MAFRSAQDARAYIGLLGVACYADTFNATTQVDTYDVTTFCDDSKASIPGLNTSTVSMSGPLDVDATSNGQWDALRDLTAIETSTPVTYMPLGTDGAAWLMDVFQTEISPDASHTDAVQWSMSAQASGIGDMNGAILSNAETVTVDGSSSNTDGGAATTNGGVGHLHVTAYATLTSDDIIIEGSANGSTGWATVVPFSQVTGLTSQRVEVTGAVPRYLRVTDDVLGTGSITPLVSFSRR